MPPSFFKQTLPVAKAAKKKGVSPHKDHKKLRPSFYSNVNTKKGPNSPEKQSTDRGGVDKDKKITQISSLAKAQQQHSNHKPPVKIARITTKASKANKASVYSRALSIYSQAKPRTSEYKVIKSPHHLTHWVKGHHRRSRKSKRVSLMNLGRLRHDGRKLPEEYKQRALAAQSPSQLSLKSISELYVLQPNTNFATFDDVFSYRGYKKLQKIDEGAFGIVSKAMRLSDRILVAVKEVDLRRKRTKRIEEMKRELFVLQKVDDENVVKLIEHFIIDHMLVIIMEFCAGGNLTSYLKETAINEQEALFLFKQMALSIRVLHKKGIAHRDVKLNNFLLDSTRKLVKIGDFGLSVVSFRTDVGVLMAKTYCGTEPYMAPEILKRNSLGFRSYNPLYADIWSLGVCLFAMLTRTFPFKMHTSQQGLFKAQVTRRWRFPRSLRDMLSEEIKDLVWHMLDPEPERRISITGVISHPWLNQNQLIVLSYGESETESTHSSIR